MAGFIVLCIEMIGKIMTIDEVLKHYLTHQNAANQLGFARTTITGWVVRGFIPIKAQIKIYNLTGGLFKIDINHIQGNINANT